MGGMEYYADENHPGPFWGGGNVTVNANSKHTKSGFVKHIVDLEGPLDSSDYPSERSQDIHG